MVMMNYAAAKQYSNVFAEDMRKPPEAVMMRRKGSLIMKRAYYLMRRA